MTADAAEIIAKAARAALAAGATDWPALRRAMQVALAEAGSPHDLVDAAARAGLPRRRHLIENRNALLHEIAQLPKYSNLGRGGKRAAAEAIEKDLSEYQLTRFPADSEPPQHDPDRLFHRIISNGSAVIGDRRKPLSWNSIYLAIVGSNPTE